MIVRDTKLLEKLTKAIEVRTKRFHTDFSLPLAAEMWEEVLHRSMLDVGIDSEWDNGRSHKVGEDINTSIFGRISCKSGVLKDDCVSFNGSRTGKYVTLEEKINFLSSDHDDCYFLLSKNTEDICSKNFRYKILIFSSSVCKTNTLKWEETIGTKGKYKGKVNGWKGTGDFNAMITKSTSGQLWTELPLNKVEHIIEIDGNPS